MPFPDNHDPYFPWNHLALRSNPFQSLTRDDWSQIAVLPRSVEDWVSSPTDVLQIIGDKGSGKSSCLLALQRTYEQKGRKVDFVYLPSGGLTSSPNLELAEVLILDEAQRLNMQMRSRIFEWVQTRSQLRTPSPLLILGTHHDHTDLLKKYALIWESIETDTLTEIDLARIAARRVEYFSLEERPKVHFQPESITFLLRTFEGDLRAMEAFLFDFFQAIPDTPDISAMTLSTAWDLSERRSQYKRD